MFTTELLETKPNRKNFAVFDRQKRTQLCLINGTFVTGIFKNIS